MADDEEFDWTDETVVVVKTVHAVAVYTNSTGDVVIRQRDTSGFHGDDNFVIVPPEKVADLVEALQRESRESK